METFSHFNLFIVVHAREEKRWAVSELQMRLQPYLVEKEHGVVENFQLEKITFLTMKKKKPIFFCNTTRNDDDVG